MSKPSTCREQILYVFCNVPVAFTFSYIKYVTWISWKEAIQSQKLQNTLPGVSPSMQAASSYAYSVTYNLSLCIIDNVLRRNLPHVNCISHIAFSHIHISAVHALQQISITLLFNIKIPFTPRSFKWYLSYVSPPKPCIHLSSPISVSYILPTSGYSIWIPECGRGQIMKLLTVQYPPTW
jgi:hypothetical protein